LFGFEAFFKYLVQCAIGHLWDPSALKDLKRRQDTRHNNCHYGESCVYFIVTLNVTGVSVVAPSEIGRVIFVA